MNVSNVCSPIQTILFLLFGPSRLCDVTWSHDVYSGLEMLFLSPWRNLLALQLLLQKHFRENKSYIEKNGKEIDNKNEIQFRTTITIITAPDVNV